MELELTKTYGVILNQMKYIKQKQAEYKKNPPKAKTDKKDDKADAAGSGKDKDNKNDDESRRI